MDTVTYPHPTVISFLEQRFVPVKLHVADKADALEPYAIPWTPGLIVLDAELHQHRRMVGYHPPRDLIAELSLARLIEALARGEFVEAHELVPDTIDRCRGDLEREAEARYFGAAAEYKATGDGLKKGWVELTEKCPGTTWAKKVEFIRDQR